MRTLFFTAFIGLFASFLFSSPVRSDGEKVGTPLFRNKMKDWTRFGSGKNPWLLNADGVLSCAAKADSYTFDEILGNGNLHLEWRFVPTASNVKKNVKASIDVRLLGELERCRISLGNTDCGLIVTSAPSSGDRIMDFETKPSRSLAKETGDWNTMDIKLTNEGVEVIVNGKLVSSSIHGRKTGVIALNTEGDPIDFRNIRWQPSN